MEEFYKSNYHIVYGFLLSLCADPVMAEELTAETFARAIEKLHTYNSEYKASTWLCTIGKNLFYNSPMEACIVICNTGKPKERKDKILFINAKDEITRKNAQSYLEDFHIQRIADSYNNFTTEDSFSAVATIEEISSEKNDYSLGISKYVTGAIDPPASKEELDLAITQWLGGSNSIRDAYKRLNEMISGGEQNGES